MKHKRLKFILFLFFGVLLFSACSTKHQGKYDDFFSDEKGWIPVNTQNKDLTKGNK